MLFIVPTMTFVAINIVIKLFTISVNFILPIFFNATDNINKEIDNPINPFVFFLVSPSSGNVFNVWTNNCIATAKPPNAIAICPRFKLPRFLIEADNISKLTDKLIKAKLLLAYILSSPILVNSLKHSISSAITRPIAPIPFTNEAPSILDKTHIEPAKIATALAIFINVLASISFW